MYSSLTLASPASDAGPALLSTLSLDPSATPPLAPTPFARLLSIRLCRASSFFSFALGPLRVLGGGRSFSFPVEERERTLSRCASDESVSSSSPSPWWNSSCRGDSSVTAYPVLLP